LCRITASEIFSPLGFIQSNGTGTFAHSNPGSHGAHAIGVTAAAPVVVAVVAAGSGAADVHAARASADAATTAARVREALLSCRLQVLVVAFIGLSL
jgi:hypothetical protein